jgi:hypothetical protein
MKEIAKDLLRKDSVDQENILLWKNSDILTNQLRLKDAFILNRDSVIQIKNQLLSSKDTIISYKDSQFKAQKEISDKLEKKLKKERNKSILTGITGGAIITGLIVLLAIN